MEENQQQPLKKKKTFGSRFLRVLLGLLLLLLLLSFAVNIPFVQKWGVNRITNYLSNRLETNVSVESFDLNVFRHLEVGGILIEHPERSQDTLLYSRDIRIKFNSLFSLFKRKLIVNEISLNDGMLQFERTADRGVSTVTYLLERLSSQTKKKNKNQKSQFDFKIGHVNLHNMKLTFWDGLKSINQRYTFNDASFSFRNIDFEQRILQANSIEIRNSSVKMVKTDAPISPYWDSILNIKIIDTTDLIPWKIEVSSFNVENVQLDFDNFFKSPKPRWASEYIDLHHFSFDDIDIKMNDFSVQDLVFQAEVENIHLLHKNGFEIQKLSAEKAYLDEFNLKLDGWILQTKDTYLKNSISLVTKEYEDYDSFEDLVKIQFNSPGSKIAIRDFVRMVPSLSSSLFFQKNMDKTVFLTGFVNGPINGLNIQNMKMGINGLELKGEFTSKNLAFGENQNLSLNVDTSSFSVFELESIIPNLAIPQNFNNLGQISFKGVFEGSFEDFIAFGDIETELGIAKADIKLNLIEGIELASYTGALGLINFDLGKFTNNEDFGRTSFQTRIINGRGLTTETASVDLDGKIEFIEYSGYKYEDVTLKGDLNQKLFDGSVTVHNGDIDLDFNGLIDHRDSIPNYEFKANARNLDLFQLNLIQSPLTISGNFDVNMRALDLDRLFGLASGSEINLTGESGEMYSLDSFSIESRYDDIDFRVLEIKSDVLSGQLAGDFKILEVVPIIKRHLKKAYPRFFPKMQLPDSIYRYGDQQFNFTLEAADSKNWFNLFGVPTMRLKEFIASGNVDTKNELFSISGILPQFHYQNFNIYETKFEVEDISGNAHSSIHLVAGDINEKFIFEDIRLENSYTNDSLVFAVQSNDLLKSIDQFGIEAQIYPGEPYYSVHFKPIDLQIFGEQWAIDDQNNMLIGKDKLEVTNFVMSNGDVDVHVFNLGEKGIEITGAGFDTKYLNEIWDYERLNFEGAYSSVFQLKNLFQLEDYSLNIHSPQLLINQVDYGVLNIDVDMPNLSDSAIIDVSIIEGEREINGKGYFYLPLNEVSIDKRNDWFLDVDVRKLPMMFWQYIIGDNISNTEGYVDADLVFDGKINKTDLRGTGRVFNGKTKVNYLGTTYSFHDQPIVVTPTMIDLTGTVLTDEDGNRAIITGGITHKHIKDLGLDAVISSPKFIGLKTTPEDNSTYYGYVVGRMYATFRGLMDRPSITLNGETAEGTYLAIPVDYSTETSETDFVTFTKFTRETAAPVAQEDVLITGVDFKMDVTVNEGSTMELIFDKQSGEILRGVGNGDIQFSLTRNGVMNMTGVYEIEQGNYLFTNFLIRKPFVIKQGGTIRWDGNPFEADLNIEAEYERLRASTAIFIEEYLTTGSASARSDASIKTDVDLTLIITGILSAPDLDFEISFPNLNGEVKGYVDSKMRILKSDDNAMLEQVMGLLLTRSFLPTNTIVNSAGQVATSSLNNTVSELISSQLSNYLSGFFTNAADNISFINSIEFDVGVDFNPFGQANITDGSSLGSVLTESGNEVEVRTKYYLFDDRLTFDLGGNYTTESPLLAGGKYFAGDYALEYNLTNNKRLKIRFFHRNDLTIEGRKNKLNLGFTYRREFDNFSELFKSKNSK